MAICPNCGGENFHYQLRSAGTNSKTKYYRTGVRKSRVLPAGKMKHQSERKEQSVGICPDCGYIEKKQEKSRKADLSYLLYIFVWPILLSVWFFKTDSVKVDKKWKALIIAGFWIVFIAIGSFAAQDDGADVNSASVWNENYTAIEDFTYYIDNNSIILKSYKAYDKKVSIAQTYDIDGIEMPVVALDGTFSIKSVTSVIVPEGVTKISENTFSSSNVKYLYLPATLSDFSGWSYFCDVEKIYYGGTEKQWAKLYTGDRSQLDVVQIVCNSDISSLANDE